MTDAAEARVTALSAADDGLPPTAGKSLPVEQSLEALKDITFGSIAGIIGKTIEYPFDTVKVRLQSQPDTLPLRYTGPLDCFRQSIHAEGLPSLYRGISAPLLGAAIETSSLFFSYRIAQDVLQLAIPDLRESKDKGIPLPLSALATCGAASGAFTSLLLTPIELVKCRMQVPLSSRTTTATRSPGPLSVISSVLRHHGILGFWHGQLGTLIRETGGSAAWFGSYEGVSALFRTYNDHTYPPSTTTKPEQPPQPLPLYQQLLAGAAAGVTYNFICFPADTIKSRMQTEEVVNSETNSSVETTRRKTFLASGKALWRQQGLRGMYRGCGITVARAAPSSAFIFAVYEGLRGWWG
ncbi:mitochondrial ornithine carrier protein [Lecanora helva]